MYGNCVKKLLLFIFVISMLSLSESAESVLANEGKSFVPLFIGLSLHDIAISVATSIMIMIGSLLISCILWGSTLVFRVAV